MILPQAVRRVGKLALACIASMTLTAATASAQSSRAVRNACNSDAKRMCPREKPDSPEMHYCMEAKGKLLSSRCIRALEDDGVIPRGHFKS